MNMSSKFCLAATAAPIDPSQPVLGVRAGDNPHNSARNLVAAVNHIAASALKCVFGGGHCSPLHVIRLALSIYALRTC